MDRKAIPDKFSKLSDPDCPVRVRTVGELKKALDELPNDLAVRQGFFKDGVEVCVYNIDKDGKYKNAFLELEGYDEQGIGMLKLSGDKEVREDE